MKDVFFKYPSTPHLAVLDGIEIRDDKVLSEWERDDFLRQDLVVEEKLDGANLGISFDSKGNFQAQNRGAYLQLPWHGQWKKLGEWLVPRTDFFFEHLTDRYILFGEWCYAQHSVFYDRLPDWFLGFDIYDKQIGRFLSSYLRDSLFKTIRIDQVPIIARGCFTNQDLKKLLSHSKFTDRSAEGLYLRIDQNDWLLKRAKLVRPEFIQTVKQHWTRSIIKPNQLSQWNKDKFRKQNSPE